MKYSEGNIGRIYVLRLEDGDKIPDIIEKFAEDKQIKSGLVFFLGGAGKGSKIISGPEDSSVAKPVPMINILNNVYESSCIGTIFLNEKDQPKLHMHGSFGRKESTITGCVREGVNVWLVGEVVILEITNCTAKRSIDKESGFELLSAKQS